MVEVKPINISLNQQSPSLSVRTAISPTLTEEFIIHPSVYSEIEKLGHAKSDVLLNESESSLGAHACSTKLKLSIVREKCSDIVLCKKANGAMKTSSVEFMPLTNHTYEDPCHFRFALCFQILLWSPWKYRCGRQRTRSGASPLLAYNQKQTQSSRAGAANENRNCGNFELVKGKENKTFDIRAEKERERRTREVREQALPSEYHRQSYL
ncbi:hypothetical protein TNCV_4485041 [Trichonephila clavipes]|nr:hypothetical protein TNCV_4485041 [Trichonephila clavipes]